MIKKIYFYIILTIDIVSSGFCCDLGNKQYGGVCSVSQVSVPVVSEEMCAGISTAIREIPLELHGLSFFTGTDFGTPLVRSLTCSKWAHVGIVLRDSRKDMNDQTGWYHFQAVGLPVVFGSWALKFGFSVQVGPWLKEASVYKGGLSVRPLRYDVSEKKPTSATIKKFMSSVIGKPYKTNILTLFKSVARYNTDFNQDSFFCSELVAHMFMEFGFLSKERLASNYMPKDFSSEESLLFNGISLGEEVVMATPQDTPSGCYIS